MRDDLFHLNIQTVNGATHPQQAEALYGLVRWFRPLSCVEVGSFHGYTTCWIGHALRRNGIGHLWAIDSAVNPGADLNTLEFNLERMDLGGVVTVLKGDHKAVAWPDKVDYAHVDGAHSDEACLWDLNQAVGRGAWLLTLHDTTAWWGPAEVLAQLREADADEWDILEDESDCGLVVMKRRPADKPAPWYTRELYPDGGF